MCGLKFCITGMHMCNHPRLCILLLILLTIIALFDGVMKVIAMWRSARNNHLAWFICLAIFNTIGILPIIYLIKHGKKSDTPVEQ